MDFWPGRDMCVRAGNRVDVSKGRSACVLWLSFSSLVSLEGDERGEEIL